MSTAIPIASLPTPSAHTGGGARREAIRATLAQHLRLPVSMLQDATPVVSLGLDSLGLAQAVIAVEGVLEAEVDTERLSERLAPEMTVGDLVDGIEASLVGAA